MNAHNLTPTLIIDKNGKQTTVHKNLATTAEQARSLPLPALTAPAQRPLTEEQREYLINQSHQRLSVVYDTILEITERIVEPIITRMRSCSDNTIIAIHQYFMLDIDTDKETQRNRERIDFIDALFLDEPTTPETTIHEYLTFRTAFPDSDTPFTNTRFHKNMAVVRALHDYPELPTMDNYANAEEDLKAKISALVSITTRLFDHYGGEYLQTTVNAHLAKQPRPDLTPLELGIPLDKLTEPDDPDADPRIRLHGDFLTKLVLDHPEKATLLARYIIEDKVTDPNLLKEMIESKTPTLRNGML